MKRDYDIIVAGGGLAGLIVASSAMYYSKQSLKILVIDRMQSTAGQENGQVGSAATLWARTPSTT